MRFVDEVEITCISGKGGAGGMSFRREKHVPYGGPDGGDGGRGGSLVLRATERSNTLDHLRGRRVYEAKDGTRGSGNNSHGRHGEDHVVLVPVGTTVLDLATDVVLADLDEDGAEAIVCRGGQGGRGNARFKTPNNRTPTRHDPGGEKIERDVRLELKLIADVGLLGFPNAGKSTFISTVSNAKPKVADYPFTTLVPNLGVVSRGWEGSFVIADIPGLVQGASEGVGLGHRFLKHVERCRFFLHLVSASTWGEPVEDPVERYRAINAELAAFSEELAQRPQIVVLTKVDLVDEVTLSDLSQRFRDEGVVVVGLSSVTSTGVKPLLDRCWRELSEMDA
ncbi:MAG: GTPase ObgE [Proteobacteria bacterium]|nr:GTPase ObgE [Pseudomonadota bacterium]MCP4920780.1 GTPase ObgE [Pseudomonadota bacterium]